mmetsp:Transcript_125857/g.391945  ORF Transcript_125857/g.391945 Transcript_125857/m.391945 type:complete len:81 (+) Transcript_125857:209-451(+)
MQHHPRCLTNTMFKGWSLHEQQPNRPASFVDQLRRRASGSPHSLALPQVSSCSAISPRGVASFEAFCEGTVWSGTQGMNS